ncbi:MAG TPA: ABC-type transport auxiliary lipoprotein family protein [bacterium]|nr:ABC-type transport auxiliary lipoprotein family protein [bacterium]HPR86962.1 ABC-type transport auxiliary lipoprotein family protein [bacterium]
MRNALILAALALCCGCGRVPQVHYYDLVLDAPAPAAAPQPATLWVQPFSALPPSEQDRMVYRDSVSEIQFDAYRRWIAAPPELLRERLVAWLRASGRFSAVVTALPRREACTTLAVQLVRFEETAESGQREAVTRFWYELTDAEGGRLGSGYIEGRAVIPPGSAAALIAAMRDSAARAFAQLLERL